MLSRLMAFSEANKGTRLSDKTSYCTLARTQASHDVLTNAGSRCCLALGSSAVQRGRMRSDAPPELVQICNAAFIPNPIRLSAGFRPTGGSSREVGMTASQAKISDGSGNDRPIKVLVLVPSLDIGGAEIDLLRNLPVLDRNRFAPIVSALREQGTLSTELSNAGVKVTSLRLDVPAVRRREGSRSVACGR